MYEAIFVETIFIGVDTKEYSLVIFFSIKKYKITEKCNMFSYIVKPNPCISLSC
jgi:hypothetical protein